MVDRHYLEAIWFCLALTLAISLSAIGLVILYDYAVNGAELAGRITFRPGEGVLLLLTSATLLAFIFKRKPLSTSLALGLSVTAIACVAIPLAQEALFGLPQARAPFRITPLMALVSLLITASVLATLHGRKGPVIGGVCGLLAILLGVASLLSHWLPQLQPVGLGGVPESTIVVSPLVILLGLILPGLHTFPPPHTPTVSKSLILIGVLGIAITTASWHAMRLQHSADVQQRAEQLAPGNNLPAGELYLPPLILFTGLGLSFLVLLSHVFWRESEHRATRLEDLNKTLNILLDEERSLRRTNERIMAFSKDILCSVNADGLFTMVSPACRDILGYEPQELIGQPYDILMLAEDRRYAKEELQRLVGSAQTPAMELHNRHRHRNGHEVTLSWTAVWSDEDQALFCVGRDISAQLTAAALTRERDQFFSLSPDMFCIVDINSHFFEVNRAFMETLKYRRDELIGTPYMELIHNQDREKVIAAVESLVSGTVIHNLEVRVFDKAGKEHWLQLSASLSRDNLIYCAARDTTEIRRFAERQATIFESITDAFFTLNRNWCFTYVNKRSEELLRRSRHELLGHSIWDEFPDAVGSEFESQYRHAMASGESVAFEAYYPPLETWFEVSAYPSEEGLGVYYRSVTERIEAQKRLKETMAELERSNKELRDFAFAASHDLQEPLRKIQAFSDRLLTTSGSLGEQDKDYLKRMQSAANRMQSLIQDLLTYSRVTTRAKPFVTCNTNQILSEVLQDMETTIARENATIETRPLPHVKGDPTQIRQVLQNLLSNAVKFHKKDKAPVVLVYSEHETSEGWTLVVSDNGIGFDDRYADKLFDPFQRLHQRQDFAGTGIGMAIVKKILDRHGATVSVDSAPDRGTTFKIRFEHG